MHIRSGEKMREKWIDNIKFMAAGGSIPLSLYREFCSGRSRHPKMVAMCQ